MNKEEALKILTSTKGLLEISLREKELYESLRNIADKFGEDFVFNFFDQENNYSLFYFDLARAGIQKSKPSLLKMINDPNFCEKDNEQDPYYGSIGLLFLNDPAGLDYCKKFLNREIEELYYQSNDEFVDDLILKKTDATSTLANYIIEEKPSSVNKESLKKLKDFLM